MLRAVLRDGMRQALSERCAVGVVDLRPGFDEICAQLDHGV